MSRKDELFEALRKVPRGRVISYGEAGSLIFPRVSGLIAGRWMDQCPGDGCPWWRVVGADGSLKIARKSAEAALIQQRRLEEEGVVFVDGKVEPRFFEWDRFV